MKNTKHSLGWHTVRDLNRKNNIKNAIIVILSIACAVSVVWGFFGGS